MYFFYIVHYLNKLNFLTHAKTNSEIRDEILLDIYTIPNLGRAGVKEKITHS